MQDILKEKIIDWRKISKNVVLKFKTTVFKIIFKKREKATVLLKILLFELTDFDFIIANKLPFMVLSIYALILFNKPNDFIIAK